jgi:enoyl-CoA hydratase/3-hydroxyacyl-CoA dehydrogenase
VGIPAATVTGTASDVEAATQTMSVVERFGLKALVEACLLIEDGVATTKDTELGMMMGAGILPGPLARADEEGLDAVLERLEAARREWGDAFEPPRLLRRLVNQGRLGKKAGQGFFFYPRPDDGLEQPETVVLETRDEIAILWLNRPPTNPISPQMIRDLTQLWEHVEGEDAIRAAVICSSNFAVFSAGADIKEFTKMTDPAAGQELLDGGHAVLRRMEQSSKVTIAAVNSLALGGGCELTMACDFRIAARSASFGQPEINLGIIPGFGGTQRLARLVGEAKALEMNLVGEPISAVQAGELGLANEVVPDHDLFDTALGWARKLAGQAPIAVHQIKQVSAKGDLDEGIEAEKAGFAKAFTSEDAREGIEAFLGKRKAKWQGK